MCYWLQMLSHWDAIRTAGGFIHSPGKHPLPGMLCWWVELWVKLQASCHVHSDKLMIMVYIWNTSAPLSSCEGLKVGVYFHIYLHHIHIQNERMYTAMWTFSFLFHGGMGRFVKWKWHVSSFEFKIAHEGKHLCSYCILHHNTEDMLIVSFYAH